jgi:hypothetical protein
MGMGGNFGCIANTLGGNLTPTTGGACTPTQIPAGTNPKGGASSGPVCNNAAIVADYQNILGRAPDASGLAFWQNAAANGESLACIANSFYSSPEYQAKMAGGSCMPAARPYATPATGEACVPAARPFAFPANDEVCVPAARPFAFPANDEVCVPAARPYMTPATGEACVPAVRPYMTPATGEACMPINPAPLDPCTGKMPQGGLTPSMPGYCNRVPTSCMPASYGIPMTQSQWAQTGAAQVPGNTYQDYLSQLNQPISQPQACMSGMTAGLGSKGSPTYAGCGDAAAFQRMQQAYGSPVCQALQCLTANPAGSSIANLYQQDLGRTADVPGLQFWMTQLQNGNMTLCQINQAIKNSPEAKTRKTS